MAGQRISKDEYLDKNFDYTKLTKQELRQIMSENDIEDIPNLTALKSVILESYKENIYDKIDEITKKFSEDNVFQNERKKGGVESANVSFRDDSLLGDKSFDEDTRNSSLVSSLANSTMISSKTNTTMNSHKKQPSGQFKIPFIAIPKKNGVAQIQKPKYLKSRYFLKGFLFIFGFFLMYLKFLCPYCKPGNNDFVCIPIPPHTQIVGNRLIADEGYRLIRNIIDFCVIDNSSELQNTKRVNDYIKMLEQLRGDFKYGFSKTPRIRVSAISDPKVLSGLQKSGKVVFSNGLVEATRSRVSLRSFLKFYFYFLMKVLVGIVCFSMFLKIFLSRRRSRNQLKKTAAGVAKEVLETLNRQIMMSVKSSQFKPQVSSIQMRDALEIKDEIWKFVDEIITKNSNVEKSKDPSGQTTWKWIGPVLYKSNEPLDFQ